MKRTSSNRFDVILIGAGAAGLMAAASAAQRGRSVLLLEKNKKLGVKILMSGGTRCNLTHDCSVREFVSAFGRNGKFLHSPLAALPPEKVLELFHQHGVPTKVESTGKIFPTSNRAIDVRDALVQFARNSGAKIWSESPVSSVEKNEDGFQVTLPNATVHSTALIITSGGKSYPGCGTTGDGYAWARSMGHTITPLGPALTPIVSQVPWANALKGIAIDDIKTQIVDESGNALAISDQPTLFTHFGFSGPGPMNISRPIGLNEQKKFRLKLDLAPNDNEERVFQGFQTAANNGDAKIVGQLLNATWPRRFREALFNQLGTEPNTRTAELSKAKLRQIAHGIKHLEFPVHGTRGYAKAEVTAGGVELKEVNSSTMESKIVSGLFFAGEILDLDGPIGGFNFQSAFSTGWLAGQNC